MHHVYHWLIVNITDQSGVRLLFGRTRYYFEVSFVRLLTNSSALNVKFDTFREVDYRLHSK